MRNRRIHPATAVLLVHGVGPLEVAEHAGYAPRTVYQQLRGQLALTRRTFDAITELGSVDVALKVCAALDAKPMELPPGGRSNGPPPCGTWGGYRGHLRRGEPTCAECRAFMTAYERDRRARKVNASPGGDALDVSPTAKRGDTS